MTWDRIFFFRQCQIHLIKFPLEISCRLCRLRSRNVYGNNTLHKCHHTCATWTLDPYDCLSNSCSCFLPNVNYTITSTTGAECKESRSIAHAQSVTPSLLSPSLCPIARDRIDRSAAQPSWSPLHERITVGTCISIKFKNGNLLTKVDGLGFVGNIALVYTCPGKCVQSLLRWIG